MIGAFRLNTLSAAMAVAGDPTITATGGTVTYSKTGSVITKIHNFNTSGSNSFIVSAVTGTPSLQAYLVAGGGAGGGSSGSNTAGGGGSGGWVLDQTVTGITAQTYTISIGAGGTVSGFTTGGNGGDTTGFGYTSPGGKGGATYATAGQANTGAAGSGAGAGSSTGSNPAGGAGTYAGGNGFGAGGFTRASGGGAGAGGAGGNAAASTAGTAGAAITSSRSGASEVYGRGGSGIIAAGGTGSAASGSEYGGGGGGGGNAAGGAGRQGKAIVTYTVPNKTYTFFSGTTSTTNGTWPSSLQAGDLAVFINCATEASTTVPTTVVPTGFTSITNSSLSASGASMKTIASYKILTGSETGTITGMNSGGTRRCHLFIYRPSSAFESVIVLTQFSETATTVPTSQSISLATKGGPYVAFGVYQATGAIGTRSSTVTETRELSTGTTNYTKTFEATSSSVSFSNPSISMTDGGTNCLMSFILQPV